TTSSGGGNAATTPSDVHWEFNGQTWQATGIMVRVGHLRDLAARFQQLADAFPPPLEGDSHTTNVAPGQTVTVGETIATAVGLRATKNVFFDFGVYDLRARNAASANPAWLAEHS